MEKLEWLQAFAEPEQPETGAAAPTPEQQERLAALSPEGTQALTQEQCEAAMRQGYARLKAQFAAVQAVYPQAELSRALEDPRFLRLVTHGVDAKSAYELTHQDGGLRRGELGDVVDEAVRQLCGHLGLRQVSREDAADDRGKFGRHQAAV